MVAQTQKTQKTNLSNIDLYYRANALVCRNISPHGGGVQSCILRYKMSNTKPNCSLHSETTWIL